MDGIASISSVGAVASQVQLQSASFSRSAAVAQSSTNDTGSSALKLIQSLTVSAPQHDLDLKG